MCRQIQQQALLAETLADFGHQCRQIHIVGIDLVDHDHAAQAAFTGQREHALGRKFDAVLGVDDDQRRVHCRQCTHGLAGKVRKTGGIN